MSPLLTRVSDAAAVFIARVLDPMEPLPVPVPLADRVTLEARMAPPPVRVMFEFAPPPAVVRLTEPPVATISETSMFFLPVKLKWLPFAPVTLIVCVVPLSVSA